MQHESNQKDLSPDIDEIRWSTPQIQEIIMNTPRGKGVYQPIETHPGYGPS